MANARNKNTIYVDATGDLTPGAQIPVIYGVMVTPSAANSVVSITSSSVVKIYLKFAGTDTQYIEFAQGIEMNPTFSIATLTNITNVILIGRFAQNPTGAR